ncbi:replicative DNA helicase [Bacillus sp. BRMEA1]|uniref:replicative DNA helicase n=1 Tax=Neobacillus endophyticus TaxID=2738405 RepID=UPI0015667838|nr:replicative DNA helicase [Neobacillus endophyticus]NRD81154.1 replicative DNA helicase [Neobacillus endophyticus]
MIESFYNIEAERSVLGAILLEPDEVLEKIELNHLDFFEEKNRYIVKAIQALMAANHPVDLVTLTTWLAENKLIENIGGVSYLSDLSGLVPTTKNVEFYQGIIKKNAKKRKIQKTLQRMQDKLYEVEDEDEIDNLVSSGINVLTDAGTSKETGFTHIKDVMMDVLDNAEIERGEVVGIPTGFSELDRMLSGWKPGELIIVGARPSMGKTQFALNLTTKAARYGALVPFYSLEMVNRSLGQRILASEAQVNSRNIKIGTTALTAENWSRLFHEAGLLGDSDILLNDKSGVTVHTIRKDLTKLRKQNPDRKILCFIDYLQLIQGDPKHKGNRTQEISEISRSLKTIALDLNLTIVSLSQLSRGVEQRQNKRPVMSDIRESGSIEQDADVIAFLYRDDYYDKESENKNIVECIIAKQRDGATGTVQLVFIKEYGRFVNIERRLEN